MREKKRLVFGVDPPPPPVRESTGIFEVDDAFDEGLAVGREKAFEELLEALDDGEIWIGQGTDVY